MRLGQGLQSLLDIAKNGEWERIDGLLHDLLRGMEAVRSLDARTLAKPGNREQLEQIVQLLQSASLLCSERKDQITPLINAFASTISTPAKP